MQDARHADKGILPMLRAISKDEVVQQQRRATSSSTVLNKKHVQPFPNSLYPRLEWEWLGWSRSGTTSRTAVRRRTDNSQVCVSSCRYCRIQSTHSAIQQHGTTAIKANWNAEDEIRVVDCLSFQRVTRCGRVLILQDVVPRWSMHE